MLFESDVYFLQQLFFPQAKTVALLDPENQVKPNFRSGFIKVADQKKIQEVAQIKEGLVLINMTNIPVKRYPFYEEGIEGIINLGKKGEFFNDFTRDTFYYIQNDIKTIRWVYPNNLRHAFFLRFYDADAAYGNLFKGFCALAGLFRELKWIADGKFYVLHKGQLFFDNLGGKQYDSFTLFLKDSYHTGKGLLQFIQNDQIVTYAKYPLFSNATVELEQENKVLHELNKYDFNHLRFPAVDHQSWFLQLSNILSLRHKPYTSLRAQHFRAIGEYTRAFCKEMTLENWLKKVNAIEKLAYMGDQIKKQELPKGISPTNLARLYRAMTHLLNGLPIDKTITVSLVHGDFTEENMTIEEGRLKVLDWEKAAFDYPALGDFIEFEVYRMEYEGKPDLQRFMNLWDDLVKKQAFQELCKEFSQNFFIQFKAYLLVKNLNTWWEHLSNKFLPYYTNWQIDFWRNLIEAFEQERSELNPLENDDSITH